jgi:hypothetical protein
MVDTAYLGKQDPNINTQLLTAQQQLALAQALRGQSMQPIQAPSGQNGKISGLSVLAQMLNGYVGNNKVQSATQDLATAQSAQAQAQARMLMAANSEDAAPVPTPPTLPTSPTGAPQSPSAGGGTQPIPAAAAPAPNTSATPATPTSDSSPEQAQARALRQRGGALEALGLGEKAKALYDQAGQIEARIRDRSMPAPTDTEKMLLAQGIQRGTPAWNSAMQGAVTKANYIAPVQVAQGNVALDPATNQPIIQNPKMDPGMVADFKNPLAPTASAIPGYAQGNAVNVAAEEKAKVDAGIRDVTLPTGEVVPVRAGAAAAAGGAQAGLGTTTYTGNPLPPDQLARLRTAAQAGDKNSQLLINAYDRAQPRLGADPTVQAARTGQQTALAEKWKPLNDAASSVQAVNSRLDTIQDLAARASTGPLSDKIQYANSLLSLAGSEKATDAATAKALLDKNANQIVAQLGQGGMATDAARAIISSAYPNSKMPAPAIREAADNLKAANSMMAAKARVLEPHYLKNDPVAYQQAETQFNAVADPRVFQWYSMRNPQEQAAYAKRIVAQDPKFRAKVQALTDMGALK